MRRRILCLNLNLFFLASVVSAQTRAVKVCVTQDNDDGYDAPRKSFRRANSLTGRRWPWWPSHREGPRPIGSAC